MSDAPPLPRESAILAAIRAAINATGRARLVRNNVGLGQLTDHSRIPYGLGRGSPDLVGTLRNGVCFCIEVKRPGGRLTDAQRAWWRAARAWGIRGGVARSVEDAMRLLDEACAQRVSGSTEPDDTITAGGGMR